MADEYIPMEFYTDDTIAVDLGEVIKTGDIVSVNANYNQTDPKKADYIIGRDNISGALVVHITEENGSYKSSATAADIYRHVQNGGAVYAEHNGYIYGIAYAEDIDAIFQYISDDGFIYDIYIGDYNGSTHVEWYDRDIGWYWGRQKRYVDVREDGKATYNATEIEELANDGWSVYFRPRGLAYIPLSKFEVGSGRVEFAYQDADEGYIRVFEIDSDGDIREYEKWLTRRLNVRLNDGQASHNALEIKQSFDDGYEVYLYPYENDDLSIALTWCSEDTASFSHASAEELMLTEWVVYADGSYDEFEEQVASVKENALIVNIDYDSVNDVYKSSETYATICERIKNGVTVYAVFSEIVYHLGYADEAEVVFEHVSDDMFLYRIFISNNDNISSYEHELVTAGALSRVLFVTITDNVASHTSEQIAEYANNGYSVYLRPYADRDFTVALAQYDNDNAEFSYVNGEEWRLQSWSIDASGEMWMHADANLASYDSYEELNEKVGDIDKALDELHNYAQSLINGGDAV